MKKTFFVMGLMLGWSMLLAQNTVVTNQTGVGNDVQLEFVDAIGNTVETSQIGNYNQVNAYMSKQTGLYYQVYQEGDGNFAGLTADGLSVPGGENNWVMVEQIGDDNTANHYSETGYNLLSIAQYGNNNNARAGGLGASSSSIWQWGNSNDYSLSVFGGRMDAVGLQVGTNNMADLVSDASSAYQSYQYGNGNRAVMASQGFAFVQTTQIGSNNLSNQGGGYTGGFDPSAIAYQVGANNELYQSIGLVGAALHAVQLGNNNSAEQTALYGSDEISVWGSIYQQGNHNSAIAYADGSYYLYEIEQVGNRNEADLRQEFNAGFAITEAFIGQYGHDNYASVEQFGFQQTSLIQTGNNNSAVIIAH